MLLHYVLHRIALSPCHGYEILQDIDSKTDGAWRPGAGSIYPILKKLFVSGYIATDDKARGVDRKVYSITEKGREVLKSDEMMFLSSGQKWMAMRRLFLELIEPRHVSQFLSDGTRVQFQLAQEVLSTRMKEIPPRELEFMLKDYILNLERQLEWANEILKETTPTVASKPKHVK